MCHAGECSAQCLRDGASLLPSHVRSSKREAEPDVRLLLFPVVQLLGSTFKHRSERPRPNQRRQHPSCSDRRQVPWQGTLTSQLSLVALAPLEIGVRSRGSRLRSSIELITRGSQLFSSSIRGWSPEPEAPLHPSTDEVQSLPRPHHCSVSLSRLSILGSCGG